jgi:glycosyltransferase involved in cell wall biosynthesis
MRIFFRSCLHSSSDNPKVGCVGGLLRGAQKSGRGLECRMKICLVWRRYGPHHRARLRASAELSRQHGARLIGVEVANQGGEHRWRGMEASEHDFVTMFPGQALESLARRDVFRTTRRLLDSINPEVVAVSGYSKPEAQSALVWARDRQRIAIVMTQSRREDVARSPIRERFKCAIVSRFDAALAGGSPQARYVHELGIPRDRIFTSYAVVDNEFFANAADSAQNDPSIHRHLPGLESSTPFFLTAGRFIQRKNFGRLLEAYESYVRVHRGSKPWRLVILGDGPERRSLTEAASTGVSRDAITFAGYHQAEEVAVYYGLASAFIHPPLVDQWGLVVNEAMAAGLPVLVSTGAGAAEDLVKDGVNGFTFDPSATSAIAEAMSRISRPDADLTEMGRRSRELVDSWGLERFADGLWRAACAGASSAQRGMPVGVRGLIWGNQVVPRALLRWRSVEE